MKSGLRFETGWSDEDLVEIHITASDGKSTFVTEVYAAHSTVAKTAEGIARFKDQVHGGIFNIRFGEFGPEYAKGAFQARLHFQPKGKIRVTVKAQTSFTEVLGLQVASEATLYFIVEPAQLDTFVAELKALAEKSTTEAELAGA